MLHGNRTYLLQDADGQILEGHSISAGLDYPGVGPEHSWLKDTGRVTYVPATDREALDAFQLLTRIEGIIPALEPAHALAHVIKLAPTMGKDQIIVMNLCGRGDKDVFTVAKHLGHGYLTWHAPTRIDRRFAALKAEGRPALVTFVTAGDPDYDTSLAILKALPDGRRRHDRARHAVLRPDGRRAGDPGVGPARAAGGQTLREDARHGARASARGDDDTPIVLMGYYNPIYSYGNERFLDDAKAAGVDGLIVVDLPPEADDELCLPALRRGLNFIRLATPTTDDKRLPAVLANTSGFVYYVSILGITGTASPDTAQGRGGGGKDQAAHHIAGGGRLRRQDRGAGARHRAGRRRRRRRLGAGRARSRIRSTPTAAPPKKTVSAVTGLVAELAEGVRAARVEAAE